MTEIKNQTGTKKKLLIPVVVLMLLAVGLTGAAYAYSTTVTVANNSVDSDAISIDLATPSADADVTTNQKIVTFTDNFEYALAGNPAAWTKTNDINYELKDNVVIGEYKIMLKGDAAWTKFKVSSSDLLTTVLFNGKTVGNLFTVTYKVMNEDKSEQVIADTALGTAAAKGTMAVNNTYVVVITADPVDSQSYPASGLVEHIADATAQNAHNAAYWDTQFNSINFELVFEANNDA